MAHRVDDVQSSGARADSHSNWMEAGAAGAEGLRWRPASGADTSPQHLLHERCKTDVLQCCCSHFCWLPSHTLHLHRATPAFASLLGVCVQTLCKSEAANRPCPRIILVCCTALVTGGLSAEGLFQQEASDDLVHFLFGAFEEGGHLFPLVQ